MAVSSLTNRVDSQVSGLDSSLAPPSTPSNVVRTEAAGFSGDSSFLPAPPSAVDPTSAIPAATVDPANFKNGHVYLRQAFTNTYTEVLPNQVPPGSLLFVNGIASNTGSDIQGNIGSIQDNNPGRDIYTVYNQTSPVHALDIKSLNDNPGHPSDGNPGYYPQVNSLKAILEDTGGNVTVMAHSMGMPLMVSAMYQYKNEGGDLHNAQLYAWGGVANSANVDQVSKWGAHVVNFVHEARYILGGTVQTQQGDNVTKDIGGTLDGGNWVQDGTLFEPHSNDSHNVGIDYGSRDGFTPLNQGHEYLGQIGDTRGK